ncbi:hypothetical protein DSO57_1007041 [Entomophthora muscae]|uniref:Uncharacterized protein n=1 Tax=Entomophthora muscae TaxID=34485 RepID=A0ACC2RMD5_9FUNG|nr:hypothetical protein DSO57_1007041 [Entomophthora muscae]
MKTQSILWFLGVVMGHSNMLSPAPRGNVQYTGYCSKGWGCEGVCDSPKEASPFNSPYNPKKIVRRGEKMQVKWLRQNHPGGFVRLAFTTMANSNDAGAFVPAKYACYESHCGEDHHDDFLGNLNGPGFGECWTEVTIPTSLPDGPITLQWTWFGGGVLFADQEAGFANYVSCSDMQLLGGAPQTSDAAAPTFEGGDPANPGTNQCRYWTSNVVGECPNGAEKKRSAGMAPQRTVLQPACCPNHCS